MHVLIVDDERLIQEFLRDLLTTHGHEAVTASNGKEGLEVAEAARPDVIISDIKMPVLDGLKMLEELHRHPDAPPVILMTGYADLQTTITALKHGAYDYLLKPIEPYEVLNTLSHVVREHELQQFAQDEHRKAIYSARMAAVGRLAAGVAHEINNPCTFIRGNAQILKALLKRIRQALDSEEDDSLRAMMETLRDQMPELLTGIEAGTERIKQITGGLIGFSSTKIYEPMAATCLNACLDDALLLLGEPQDGVRVETQLDPELPLLSVERRALTQALLCVLLNALQAVGRQDGGTVRISTESDDGQAIRVVVDDSGCGIPPNDREKVFEPFYTTAEVNEGAGLGLSIAYGIIAEDHGGRIWNEDSPLGGARFIIELTQTAKETSAPAAGPEPQRRSAAGSPASSPGRP